MNVKKNLAWGSILSLIIYFNKALYCSKFFCTWLTVCGHLLSLDYVFWTLCHSSSADWILLYWTSIECHKLFLRFRLIDLDFETPGYSDLVAILLLTSDCGNSSLIITMILRVYDTVLEEAVTDGWLYEVCVCVLQSGGITVRLLQS